jgi:polyhydroxyalkanoate synthase
MRSYLATHKELSEFIAHSSASPREKDRAQFFASLVTDALAPSNWVLGNPAAVRKILDTGGLNLLKGLQPPPGRTCSSTEDLAADPAA